MERHVPGLGVVKGLEFPEYQDVEQYRGIPYGYVPARFRQSELVKSWPDGQWEGTAYGPLCPFPKFVIGFSIVQKPLKAQHDYVMDDIKCLNLNITCPKGDSPANGWPVAVWIHGGGNVCGSGSEPGYDMAHFVNYSVELGMPTVVVTINYRFGIFGFLASDAIREDNNAVGQSGVGNYGLRDQLLAFEWVKKNISAFGGDPSRITGMGESAGSINTHLNISSDLFAQMLPFHQAILQSGVAPLTVRSMSHQQSVYDRITAHLGLDAAEDKLQALREMSTEELVHSYIALGSPMPSWQATVDGFYLKSLPKFSTLSSQKYHPSLRRLLIGDCTSEGLIFLEKVEAMAWSYEKVTALSSKVLGQGRTKDVLQTYDILPDMQADQLIPGLIRLLSDAEWSQPVDAVARSFSNGEVFYYHMNEGNPFDGKKKGQAHHAVDLLYPFLTYYSHLPENLKGLSKIIAKQWLTFINGGNPWTPFNQTSIGTSPVMLFGRGGQAVEIVESERPAYATLKMCESLQDQISELAASIRGEKIIRDEMVM